MTDGTETHRPARPVGEGLALCLRIWRETAGWTQQQLAEAMQAIGLSWTATTVAKVEKRPPTRAVSAEELLALTVVTESSVSVLLGGVRVGSLEMSPIDIEHAVAGVSFPDVPGLERPDDEVRHRVDAELARWEEAMRLLRKPVTENGRRRKRAVIVHEIREADDAQDELYEAWAAAGHAGRDEEEEEREE